MSNRPEKLHLRDLVADPATGRFSHTRLWSNIGCAVATVVFAKAGWSGQLTADVWLIYLGSVGGFAAVSKALSLRYTAPKDNQQGGPYVSP